MKKFIKFSQLIGQNPAYIQGRGGNVSYKEGNKLFIKASGLRLKDIQEEFGLIACDLRLFKNFFKDNSNKKDTDLTFVADKSMSIIQHNLKPSIEVGMHAAIPSKYVIHTHSVYVNIFSCMKSPEKLLRTLITKYPYGIIPYKNPGIALTEYLLTLQKTEQLPPILILKNHGLVIHNNSYIEIQKIHSYINTTLQKLTGKYVREKVITDKLPLIIPDAIVYNKANTESISSATKEEIVEVISALLFVTKKIRKLGGQVVYLPKKERDYILNMDREKLRIKAIYQKQDANYYS